MAAADEGLQLVLKVASRCNLNCSYCYVYNKGDETWREQPAFMSGTIATAAFERARRHCERSGQASLRITFHGGEPCLVGPQRFDAWCREARELLGDITNVRLTLQTNGVMLDDGWAAVLAEHAVDVGVSLDGPQDVHDRARVTHRGRGSYRRVVRGIEALQRAGVPVSLLTVIPLGEDGPRLHRHAKGLGVQGINYLMPDFTHDTVESERRRHGPTPCADFLIPLFDEWYRDGPSGLSVTIFWTMARLVLGAESNVDLFGNHPLRFVFVRADGALEGLDVLGVCAHGLAHTGLNVHTNDFADIAELSPLHRTTIFDGVPLCATCEACVERDTCGGGYLPHRWSRARGFDNPSVWCADLLALFAHVRKRMHVTVDETARRRVELRKLAAAC
jgi:uncharacterized protein